MTVRIRAEDPRQVQTDITDLSGRTTRYQARRGYFEMRDDHAKLHRESANLPAPSAALPVGRTGGYRCVECGFGSFFVNCGRCGGLCERE